MTLDASATAVRPQPSRPASWAARVALALAIAVAALAALVMAPAAPHASHATDGEVLAWVESYDVFDASAGLVDAAVADRTSAPVALAWTSAGPDTRAALDGHPPAPVAAGTCRARLLSGLPAPEAIGCELPKGAGDLPELEPPRTAAGTLPPTSRGPLAAGSDPSPRQAPLQRPLRPPSA